MKKKVVAAIGIGGLSTLLTLGLMIPGALDGLEGVTWNGRARLLADPSAAPAKIRVILLDQASLDWGAKEKAWPWPWPREVYGSLLDFCRRGGARAVAFDVMFTEPSYLSPEDDAALGAAIARTPGFVASVFLNNEYLSTTEGADRLGPPVNALGDAPRGPDFSGMNRPVPEIFKAATHFGNVHEMPDRDGVFRRIAPIGILDGRAVPSLGLATLLAGDSPPSIRFEPGWLHIGEGRIPLDSAGRVILRYRGPSGTYRTYSAAAILESELRLQEGGKPLVDPEEVRDAYVLFGFSAPGLLDLRTTPVSRVNAGVEIHAALLDNLLTGAALREPSRGFVAGILLLFAVAASGALLALRRAGSIAATALAVLALPVAVSFAAYAAGWAWPMAGPFVAALAVIGASLLYQYLTEGRQKAFIKSVFRHYLSPAVIERILEDPTRLKLGGERRELSIFFSDLQGFSSLSEKLDPESLTALLNDYLTDMTDILLDEGGTLDKYEGDAIIAFWNAPLPQPDHAARALRAGLRCQRKLAERRADFRARCGSDLRMRIGIHTGEVVVGNMGSKVRFDYTMLGDAANLASRLEGANKAFGTYFMASETTWSAGGTELIGRELGRIRVVGRRTPVRVFEPLGFIGESAPTFTDAFADALRLYGMGQRTEATLAFDRIAPEDPAARAYAQRSREPLRPGEEDGTWILDAK